VACVSEVIGREREQAALTAFVEGLAEEPAAVLLAGEAGVGKTVLWQAAAETARERGHLVLLTRPSPADAPLGFTGLGDLFEEVVRDVLDELPAPQADALRVALLLERPGRAPVDQRVVAVSVLSSLRALAAARPVLVAVDDVQWLDAPTAAVLSFAWRRLRLESVGLLLAQRAGEPEVAALGDAEGVRRIAVGPLGMDAVHRLVQRRLGLVFPGPTLRRLYAVAGGNPFFALELAPAFDRCRADIAAGAPVPVPERLRDVVADRINALPAATREAAAAAAALSHPTPALVAAVAGEASLAPAFSARVFEMDGQRLRFSHPLLASAAYEALDPLARRALHARLATIVSDETEGAKHLALATDAPDAGVAEALERAAERALRRGASATAAELCEQALRLTPADALADRHRRRIHAARHHWTAGDTAPARVLLEEAVASAPSSAARAEALTQLGWLCAFQGDQPQAAELARRALAEAGAGMSTQADAANCLSSALLFMGEDLEEAIRSSARTVELAVRCGDAVKHSDGLCGLALVGCLCGRGRGEALLRAATDLGEEASGWRVHGWPEVHLALAELWSDGHHEAAVTYRRLIDCAATRGDDGSIPAFLNDLALAEYLVGRWPDAETTATEALELSLQSGERPQQAMAFAVRARVEASTGRDREARADAHAALGLAGERAMAMARIQSVTALALLDLSHHRPHDAAERLRALRERLLSAGLGEPGAIGFVVDEIEALVALARYAAAAELVEWLEARGRALDRASALAAAARGRGMLAAARGERDGAIAAFQRALLEHDRVAMPFERARTLLDLGGAQRRAKQKLAARATLSEALGIFDGLGAEPWRAQAAAELARISGRRPSESRLTLTEDRIVALVVEGRTNKEVAAALYVSPKTVEAHLRSVFRKLGVRSRTALARHVLSERQSRGIPSFPEDPPQA
jgi:DNA-binding CsgD family transcriptional regulator